MIIVDWMEDLLDLLIQRRRKRLHEIVDEASEEDAMLQKWQDTQDRRYAGLNEEVRELHRKKGKQEWGQDG